MTGRRERQVSMAWASSGAEEKLIFSNRGVMVEKSKFSFGLNECLILGVRSLTRALKSLEASPGVP